MFRQILSLGHALWLMSDEFTNYEISLQDGHKSMRYSPFYLNTQFNNYSI